MPDDRDGPADDRPSHGDESLFGTGPRTGELPASRQRVDDAFEGPLFAARDDATGRAHGRPRRAEVHANTRSVEPKRTGDAEGEATSGPFPRSDGRAARRQRNSTGSFFRELPVLLLIAFVLAFLLRTFVLQVFYIPSSSMEPTLQINDRMAVEKITYQFREPRRGEIVVFEGEEFGRIDPDANLAERAIRGVGQFLGVVPASARDFVKRVIGVPGDEIVIEEGQVFVNGEPLDEPYVVYDDGSSYGPVTVPEDSLFFLGDNRPNSSDSRRGLGFVPMDDVVGRSVVIIWPPAHMGSLTGVEHELPGDGD